MNQITRCGVIAFKWAYNNELTEHNCFEGLTFCALTHKKREVLTPEQAALIFSQEWDSPYSKLANLTAMMTGMRAGEIQALRLEDIGKDRGIRQMVRVHKCFYLYDKHKICFF